MRANGAGKCTLLRILGAELAPQAGTVSLAPAGGIAGWLPQEHERMPWEPVARYIGLRTGCAETTAEMDVAAASLADPDFTNVAANRVSAALARWFATGTTDLEKCILIVRANLGLEMDGIPTGWVAPEADVVVDTSGAQNRPVPLRPRRQPVFLRFGVRRHPQGNRSWRGYCRPAR